MLQTESTQVGSDLGTKTMTDMPLGGNREFAWPGGTVQRLKDVAAGRIVEVREP